MKWIQSIQIKMLTYFFALFLMMLTATMVFYNLSMKNLQNMTVDSVENTLYQANLNTSNLLLEAQRIAYIVARDSEIQIPLRETIPETTTEFYKQRLNYNYKLFYMNKFSQDIDGMYVIGGNGAFFRSSQKSHYLQDFRVYEWYEMAVASGEPVWLEPMEGSRLVHNLSTPTIGVVVPVQDRASAKILGTVVVEVLAEKLDQFEEGELPFEGKTYLLNMNNKVVYSNNVEEAGKGEIDVINEAMKKEELDSDQVTKDVMIKGEKYLLSSKNLESNDWKIIGLISYKEMSSKVKGMRVLMVSFILCFVIFGIMLAVIGARNISKPIKKIRKTMKLIEQGDFSVRVENGSKDEIGELAHSFNHMIEKIRELLEKEQKNQEKLRYAEFKAFQAQINPHFIYNTLDSINWMVRMGRPKQVEEMIDSLTTLLRISLSRGKNFITVEEELKHVSNYIAIQKIRYKRILGSEINVPPSIYKYEVIKMILQPLVENGIYHGIKEKGEQGKIIITAEESDEKIIFCVEDTGLGMLPEKLEEIQQMMEKGIDYDPNAYGVINVQKRIQMYFGEEYGIRFESELKKGTKVFVTIPKKRGEDRHVEDCDSGR